MGIEMEKDDRIKEVLVTMANKLGYSFDTFKARHDWIGIEYTTDSGEVGLPVAILEELVRQMVDIGYDFIKIFVCPRHEKTLDLVFREIKKVN